MGNVRLTQAEGSVGRTMIRRTFAMREDMDSAIRRLSDETGNTWAVEIRNVIQLGLAERERIDEILRARHQ